MADGKPTAIVRGMDPAEHILAPAQLEHTPRSHSVDQEDSINKDAVSEKGDYAVGPVSASASEGEFEAGLSTTRVGGLTEAERQALLRSDPTLSADPPIASKIIDYIVPRRVRKGRRPKRDPDSTATQPSVFDIPELCAVYEPPDEWENKKNWDPSLRWTWREEAAVIRKVDLNVFAWCAFFFAILNLGASFVCACLVLPCPAFPCPACSTRFALEALTRSARSVSRPIEPHIGKRRRLPAGQPPDQKRL